jgi:hypothetical protein
MVSASSRKDVCGLVESRRSSSTLVVIQRRVRYGLVCGFAASVVVTLPACTSERYERTNGPKKCLQSLRQRLSHHYNANYIDKRKLRHSPSAVVTRAFNVVKRTYKVFS